MQPLCLLLRLGGGINERFMDCHTCYQRNCFILKYIGYSLPESLLNKPQVQRINSLIPIALLSALVAVQSFGAENSVVFDHRLAGVAVAAVAPQTWCQLSYNDASSSCSLCGHLSSVVLQKVREFNPLSK